MTSHPSTRDTGRVLAIGLGFFAMSAALAAFNVYVPLLLNAAGVSAAAIGLVMALDNVFGITVQPLVGMVSDHTRSPLGRRFPYIAAGAPVAALALVAAPIVAPASLAVAVGLLAVHTLSMATWRAPATALMPDIVTSPRRSRANGLLKTMSTLGSIATLALGGLLYKSFSFTGPFAMAAVLMLLALVALLLFVREPAAFRAPGLHVRPVQGGMDVAASSAPEGFWKRAWRIIVPPLGLTGAAKRSLLFMLGTVFAYTLGGNVLDSFLSLYLKTSLGVPTAGVSAIMLPYIVASLLCAFPAGLVGQRIGRKRSVLIGLTGSAVVLIGQSFVHDATTFMVAMIVMSPFFILAVVNALPMVLEMGGRTHTGTMTAYYFLAANVGAIISPILFGALKDATGNFSLMFWFAAAGMLLAVVSLTQVRKGDGEASPAAQTDAAEEAADANL
jgi:Na+/melibiose symporter-like transporter